MRVDASRHWVCVFVCVCLCVCVCVLQQTRIVQQTIVVAAKQNMVVTEQHAQAVFIWLSLHQGSRSIEDGGCIARGEWWDNKYQHQPERNQQGKHPQEWHNINNAATEGLLVHWNRDPVPPRSDPLVGIAFRDNDDLARLQPRWWCWNNNNNLRPSPVRVLERDSSLFSGPDGSSRNHCHLYLPLGVVPNLSPPVIWCYAMLCFLRCMYVRQSKSCDTRQNCFREGDPRETENKHR